MHKYSLISIIIPAASVMVFVLAFIFLKPETTGLAVYSPEGQKLVNADVILKTKSTEVIPPNAIVEVKIDDKKAEMYISDFIKKTGKEYEVKQVDDPEMGFYGAGFTGDHAYNLSLSDFNIDRSIGIGEHVFITRIIYRGKVLYEKQDKIMVSE
jgi:hypothetical protein